MANIILPPGLTDLHCTSSVIRDNPYITELINRALDVRVGKSPNRRNFATASEWQQAANIWYQERRAYLAANRSKIISEALKGGEYENPDKQGWVEPFTFTIESSYECIKFYRYYYKINSKYYDFTNGRYTDSYIEYNHRLNNGTIENVKVTLIGGLQAALDDLPLPTYVKNETDPDGYSISVPKPNWLDPKYPTFIFLTQNFTNDFFDVYGEVVHEAFGYLDDDSVTWKYNVSGPGIIRAEKGNEKNSLQGIQERINMWPRKYIPEEHIYKENGKNKVKREIVSKIGSIRKPVILEDVCGRKYKSNQWIADLFRITTLRFKHSVKTLNSTYDSQKPCFFLSYNPNHRFSAYPSWKEKNDILGDNLIK